MCDHEIRTCNVELRVLNAIIETAIPSGHTKILNALKNITN